MKKIISVLSAILSLVILSDCSSGKNYFSKPEILYKSEDLIITQLSKNTFVHTSFLSTENFGKVSCNGMIVRDNGEAVIFDTATDDKSSEELINWVKQNLECKINAVVPTHFHADNLGGLKAFEQNNIPSIAYFKTIEYAKERGLYVPQNAFKDSLILKVGNKNAIVKFFGEGHTKDNVVGYFPSENIMFGGCLIKEIGAGKGNLEDANVEEWSNSVEKIKKEFPNVKIIISGHGKYGNKELLDYTIKLFKPE
ncbi:MAG: subclass B1 metallo-beta-lactamase [Flavobacteriaceae bacterium]|jgi:metallo-beta-lactamase class B|nr:subclass B1 metallo-beta-lactamase [Flavobacteriaceae bacterium]